MTKLASVIDLESGGAIQHRRMTRSELNALAGSSALVAGQVYIILDEDRIAVSTAVDSYQAYAKESEAGGGEGVPVGGTTGQVLAKASATDYDTAWVDQSGGGGGDAGVTLLEVITCNNTFSAVDIALPASYSSFLLTFNDIRASLYAATRMIVSENNGSTFASSGYATYSQKELLSLSGSTSVINNASLSMFYLVQAREISGSLMINNSDGLFQYNGDSVINESSSPTIFLARCFMGGRILTSGSRVNVVRIYRDSSDNFVSGQIRLYGYKETL